MKNLIIFFLTLCCVVVACTNRESVPSDIIPPDSMQVILRQIIVADQFATQFLLKDSVKKDSAHRNVKAETLQLYETVFKLHRITRDDFKKSMAFYNSRPDLMKKMFDSLSVYEAQHRDELYKPKAIAPMPHSKDSLLRLRDSVFLRERDSLKLQKREQGKK